MKNKLTLLFVAFSICLSFSFSIMAQNTGAIAGTVLDQNGGVVPNATVTVTALLGEDKMSSPFLLNSQICISSEKLNYKKCFFTRINNKYSGYKI